MKGIEQLEETETSTLVEAILLKFKEIKSKKLQYTNNKLNLKHGIQN